MPISVIKEKRLLDIFNKVNFKGMIFFLNDSKSFKMMENQIKEIESINTLLDGKPNFFVVDNLGESSEVNKTYKVFVNNDENIEMLREKLASIIS